MDIEGFGKAFKIIFIPTIPLKNEEKKSLQAIRGNCYDDSCVKYRREPLNKI